jgi:methyl-accepting chemotaxis protein
VAQPLSRIARLTERVAAGELQQTVPCAALRRGRCARARSRSFKVNNDTLGRTVREDSEGRARRQEMMAAEIARFGSEIEATLAELATISAQMRSASGALAMAADNAAHRTTSAAEASDDASANVRDIASASEQLAVSVNEIERQIAQSHTIAAKAVDEAESTNAAVRALNEAAGRIGDVVSLITDIAERITPGAQRHHHERRPARVEAGRGFAVVAGE